MNIGIDMMGGDFAPLEAVKGIKLFFEKQLTVDSSRLTVNSQPSTLTLFGNQPQLESLLKEYAVDTTHIKIVGTS